MTLRWIKKPWIVFTLFTLLTVIPVILPAFAGETLKGIRARGVLRCGVSEGIPGFSQQDTSGRWHGLDIEFCRAVAAAAIDDANKVEFTSLRASERFPALKGGLIDLLLGNTTWTLGREAGLKVRFPGILFYDGQGFMVDGNTVLRKLSELDGKIICVEKGTTHVERTADFFASRNWHYSPTIVDSVSNALPMLGDGRCQAITGDLSTLYVLRQGSSRNPAAFRLLPERISREPLGPVVRDNDADWARLVRWVLFLLVAAEESGINQGNVHSVVADQTDIEMYRSLDACRIFAQSLGISSDWAVRVITSVGNYGEIYDKTLGLQSPFKMDRGLNRLWNKGGLMYAPPLR